MATNFSINARRIRDLQEVTTIGNQFVPSASYVLVDAADANNMYTSYKMKVSSLSNAISGVISQETQTAIENRFNQITADIKAGIENAISTDIMTDEFKNNIKTSVTTKLVDDGISSSIADALVDQGIAADVVADLKTNGISQDVAKNLSSDSSFITTVVTNFGNTLAQNSDFIQRTALQLADNNIFSDAIANIISSSTNFTTAIVEPVADAVSRVVSAALTADTDFINKLKDLINNA